MPAATTYWEDYVGQDTSEFTHIGVMRDEDDYIKQPIGNVKEQIDSLKWKYGKNCRIIVSYEENKI